MIFKSLRMDLQIQNVTFMVGFYFYTPKEYPVWVCVFLLSFYFCFCCSVPLKAHILLRADYESRVATATLVSSFVLGNQ